MEPICESRPLGHEFFVQITLAGLTIVVFNFVTMMLYDPAYATQKGGANGPPNWLYFT
jgi:ethanolaminephosphotransferase